MQDFEGRAGLSKWPRDAAGEVEISKDWKADGAASLRIDPGLLASVERLLRTDFRGFDALRVQVHNPSDRLATIGFELQDDHDTLYDRHRSAFGAPPGDSTVDIDLTGELWRGEENRPYRGPTKTPIDLGKISRIGFENRGDRPVFVDAVTLVRDALDVPAGAVAFDFGRRGSRVMGKTEGVFEDTVYGPNDGFGFTRGKPSFLKNAASYPSALLGDGLAWEDAEFACDLAGGPYVGWIAFERAGFWETEIEASGYSEAVLSANGAEVHRHAFSPAGPHFLFEDTEVLSLAEARRKLVWPAHAISSFSFTAKPGKNTFTLAVKDLRGKPLRVAGVFLAPDTPAGRQFVGAQEERQKRAFEAAFPETDHARRPAGSAPTTERLLVEHRPAGEIAHPRDLPDKAPSTPPIATTVSGHKAYLQLALHAARDVDVAVSATAGSASTQAGAPRFLYGFYGPKRPYEGGAAWIETAYLRPLADGETVHVGPDLARTLVLEFDVPKTAPTGLAAFVLRFTAGTELLAMVPVTVQVYSVDLPPLPVPVGVFMSALPFGPDAVGEDRWWQLQEAILQAEGEAGLNTPTGGPRLSYTMTKTGEGYAFSGDRALRYLDVAAKYGLTTAVVGYSGFLPSIKHERPDAASFQQSWAAFESAHHLPPHYLYAYDEPSTDEELSATAAYLSPFRAAGVRTIGFFSSADGDRYKPVLDATYAPAVSGAPLPRLQAWLAEGKRVFLYNRGVSRLSMGADLVSMIRLGVRGRLEWIGLYSQGFAFDDLDAREPSYGLFVVHDRLGVLPTPRWLSFREGLFDARVRLALEKAASSVKQGAFDWPSDYPADAGRWSDTVLEAARVEALRRLSESPADH